MSPDEYARKIQIKMWQKYSVGVRIWIMIANYFFAILPGILYIVRNIYIIDSKKNVKKASINSKMHIIAVVFQAVLLMLLFSQILFQGRFMSLKLVKTQILGGLVSLVFMLLSSNQTFLEMLSFNLKTKILEQSTIYSVLLLVAYSVLMLYGLSPFSELANSSH